MASLFEVNVSNFKSNMIFDIPQAHFIDHAGKTVFFQFNRLPGDTPYRLGYYPIEMPILLTML